MFATLWFLTFSAALSVLGWVEAFLLWGKINGRELANVPISLLEGYKVLALCLIVGVGSWVSALTLGDNAYQLLGYYDNYDTKQEGYGYDEIEQDATGTSIIYDLSFHSVTIGYTYVMTSLIAAGGFVFGFLWLDQAVPDVITV